MQRTPASSSNIAAYGYDAERGVLEVEFHGGRVYHYPGVDRAVYEEFTSSDSLGAFLARSIRPVYTHVEGEYVPEDDTEVEEAEDDADGNDSADDVDDGWGVVIESGYLAGRTTHEYVPTDPYQGCAECGFGPGAALHQRQRGVR